jgi:hypothetical protein
MPVLPAIGGGSSSGSSGGGGGGDASSSDHISLGQSQTHLLRYNPQHHEQFSSSSSPSTSYQLASLSKITRFARALSMIESERIRIRDKIKVRNFYHFPLPLLIRAYWLLYN